MITMIQLSINKFILLNKYSEMHFKKVVYKQKE